MSFSTSSSSGSPPEATLPKSTSSKTKRVRSEAQLARKRAMDRDKQKLRRQEGRDRTRAIEESLTALREQVAFMSERLAILGDNKMAASSPVATLGFTPPEPPVYSPVSQTFPSDVVALDTDVVQPRMDDPMRFHSTNALPLQPPQYLDVTSSVSNTTDVSSLLTLPMDVQVDCRCGIEHTQNDTCIEYWSFLLLYRTHQLMSANPDMKLNLPRNPDFLKIVSDSEQNNLVEHLMAKIMRAFEFTNLETLMSALFMVYRLLRWRLLPNPETYADVPEWIRPTEVQDSIMHPVVLDLVPWPRLREYLCQNQHIDSRLTTQFFLKSYAFLWPKTVPLVVIGKNNKAVLNEDFYRIASDLRYWRMGSPWVDQFPHLVQYISALPPEHATQIQL